MISVGQIMRGYVGSSSKMADKILIHAPNLSTPGGKQNYYDALQGKFQCDVDFFFYGSQGRKESVFGVFLRLCRDYWEFYRQLKKNNYQLVHLNPSLNLKSFFRDSIFALIGATSTSKMVVFWRGWNWDFERKYVRNILPYFRFTFGKANAMICLASDFSGRLKEYGYNKPIYLETTVVNDKIMEQGASRKPAPKRGGITLLFLSRIEKVKGIYETVDSLQSLQRKIGAIKLHIAGTGGELENLKSYVAENNLQNIEFLGWVDTDKKIQTFKEADIFVLPTYHGEGMPNCILEAMANGKPVVTTNIGGVKDFFEDGKMGFLVNIKDSEDLTQKLETLISNPILMDQMGEYNISYANERFSAKLVCQRLENIFRATITQADYKHSYPL